MPEKILLQADHILTWDEGPPEEELKYFSPGEILIEGSWITYVGPRQERPGENFDRVLALRDSLVVPGFINTHTHAAMTLFRGYADDLSLQEWLQNKIWPAEAKLKKEDIYWGTLLAIAEMLKGGTTCFADMYFHMEEVARACLESGMRVSIAQGLIGTDKIKGALGFKQSRSLVQNWHNQGEGRITVMLGPHAPYTCPPAYLHKVGELAAELQVPIHIHLAETRREVEESRQKYGKSPVELVNEVGLLEHNVLAAHCVHLTATEIELLTAKNAVKDAAKDVAKDVAKEAVKDTARNVAKDVAKNADKNAAKNVIKGVTKDAVKNIANDAAQKTVKCVAIAHNPGSNLKLGSGVAPVAELLRKGALVSLGTDGAASNNNLDLLEEMRLAALLQKGLREDPTVLPAETAFKMATLNGARALFLPPMGGRPAGGAEATVGHQLEAGTKTANGQPQAGAKSTDDQFKAGAGTTNGQLKAGAQTMIGQLKAGAKADLVVFKLNKPHFCPPHNLLAHLVYSAAAADVSMVLVDGRVLVENGRLLTIDEEKILREVPPRAQRLIRGQTK